MSEIQFAQLLLLLGVTVAIVIAFQRLHVPSSLGYLLVGILLGPYTAGPVLDDQPIRALAEFGIVFLLFTIGLNLALPQLQALRQQVLTLGTAQVVLTTAVVAMLAWIAGAPPIAAFVVGAVFAQSSTILISKQLAEQGEDRSRHGRLAIAMSVFQDVTAVPFVIVIPVMGSIGSGFSPLAFALGWAFAKAALAFVLVFILGRWALGPLLHIAAERRSAEVFTLTVLFISLVAAWTTNQLGLSMAFGAFLVGMVLGETEFRHQVESAIRPFRDVLLGLFFVGIGMLIELPTILEIWHLAAIGAVVLVGTKTLLVAQMVRLTGIGTQTAWQTGLLLAVGGEFGFAVLAIALGADAIDEPTAQLVLASVLVSMVVAPVLIRFHQPLGRLLAGRQQASGSVEIGVAANPEILDNLDQHVIICGYGRIGQSVARMLETEGIPYVALDLDPSRVKDAHTAGERVFYGDAGERDILEAVGIGTARLVVISHDDVAAAMRVLGHSRTLRPDIPIMVRTRDESYVEELRAAGATEVVPETLEASLMIAASALLLLNLPLGLVSRRVQEQRRQRYPLLREVYRPSAALEDSGDDASTDRLLPVVLAPDSTLRGRSLDAVELKGVLVTALVRDGKRLLAPPMDTILEGNDVLVLFGAPDDLQRAEGVLLD